jgi:hypothetical protein
MRTPFYLTIWEKPRVRSGRAAEALVHQAARDREVTFQQSATLGRFLAWAFALDPRVGIEDVLSLPRDRVLNLTIPWEAVEELGPAIAQECASLGLILLDEQHGRLIVPRRPGAAPWPVQESPAVSLLRNAVADLEMTGDPQEDGRWVIDGVLQAFDEPIEPVPRDIPER